MKILIEESTLRQALKILERHPYSTELQIELAATALKSALDAAEGVEPIMWFDPELNLAFNEKQFDTDVPLYAAPTPPTNTDFVVNKNGPDTYVAMSFAPVDTKPMSMYNMEIPNTSDSELRVDYKSRYEHWFKEATKARGELAELREAARAVVERWTAGEYGLLEDELERLREAL